MILRKLYWGNLRENLKRRNWSVLLCLLVMFVVLPLKQLMSLSVDLKRLETTPDWFGEAGTGMEMIRNRFLTGIGYDVVLFAAIAVCALLLAVHGYSYLFSTRKLDFYLSVPISEKRRYLVIYFNGFMIFAFSYMVMLLMCLAGGAALGAVNGKVIFFSLAAAICNLIFFAAIYNLGIIAVMLTGNILVSLLACGVLLSFEMLLRYLADAYFMEFFRTFSDYSKIMYHSFLSPAMLILEASEYGRTLSVTGYGMITEFVYKILHLLVLAVLFAAAAWILYRRRPTETAARSLAFPGMKAPLKLALMVPSGLAAGYILWEMSEKNLLFAIMGLILGAVLTHCLMEAILEADFKSIFCRKRYICAALGICIAVFFLLYSDLTGYDSWIPSEDEIKTVSFSFQRDIYGFSVYSDPFSGRYQDAAYRGEYIMDHMNTGDRSVIEAVLKLAQQDHIDEPDLLVWRKDVVPVSIKYTLKNGKTVYRSAGVTIADMLKEIDCIWMNEDYQTARLQILTPEFALHAADMEFVYSNGVNTDKYLADTEELIRVYTGELKTYSADLMLKTLPAGMLHINYDMPDRNQWDSVYSWTYPVYREFTQTMELLTEARLTDSGEEGTYVDGTRVESITLTCHNLRDEDVSRSYDGSRSVSYKPEQMVTKTFYTKEDMDAILPALYPEGMADAAGQVLSDPFDTENYEVNVVFKNGVRLSSGGSDRFVIIADRLPDHIRRQLMPAKDGQE